MPHHGMTPHVARTTLSAQARYAAGVREILECWLGARPIRDEYLILDKGRLAGTGARSYTVGNATSGSEEARRFSKPGRRPAAAAASGRRGRTARPTRARSKKGRKAAAS
jgi:formate dehydrogenase